MIELAELVLSLTGSRSEIQFCPLPDDDPTRRSADIELARRELSWQPTVSLEEGLQKTIDYFDNLLRQIPLSDAAE